MHFTEIEGPVDTSRPLIYLWEILDADGSVLYRYVGKAAGGADRPRRHFQSNVSNLIAGRPYRKERPEEFCAVHRRMAEAVTAGQPIRLSYLCNIEPSEDINAVERKWQRHFALDDGATVMADLRTRLVKVTLAWEKSFGNAPLITTVVSELDAARLVGSSLEDYSSTMQEMTAVQKGHDFIFNGARYQVKGNRPSGKRGSFVT